MVSRTVIAYFTLLCCVAMDVNGQATSAEMLGIVRDPSGAVVTAVGVRLRNLETNRTWEMQSGPEGRFRFPLLPIGPYELIVEKSGFARYQQAPIILRLNQSAELEIQLHIAGTTTEATVTADAPLINSTNAEIGFNYDPRRVAELPLAPDRNIVNLALFLAGVSPLSNGNTDQVSGIDLSVNGARPRSNSFFLDGQESNGIGTTGMVQEINNPDTIAEFRLLTHQFAAEYGRASGSVVNIITKSGTNQLRGTAYWFYNGNALNSRNNLDERVSDSAPWRIENHFAGTLGGPIVKDRTYFFGSLLRWTDHRFATGSITGVPTDEGQSLLRSLAGDRPQVKVLLQHLPAAKVPIDSTAAVTVGAQTVAIPLGTLSEAVLNELNVWQSSARVDHRFNNKSLGARYLFDDRLSTDDQAVPPGVTSQTPQRRQAVSVYFSSFAPAKFNELRASYQRNTFIKSAVDPSAEEIPSIEIVELRLAGTRAGRDRTAIGLPVDLPSFTYNNSFYVSEVMGVVLPRHSFKFGGDVRRAEQSYLIGSSVRGRLQYTTLQSFVDDEARIARISSGGNRHRLRHYDFGFFLQDEWRARPNLNLTYGVRYESPGTPAAYLARVAQQISLEHNNGPEYVYPPAPKRDKNNWAPRFGFNYRFGTASGPAHVLTGRGQLILRGGYARVYDQSFNLIFQTVAAGFPFVETFDVTPRSLATIERFRSGAMTETVSAIPARTTVGEDLGSPIAEQFALQFERELARDWAMTVGWIASKGTGLFQTVDGNPTLPSNNSGGILRVDPNLGAVRLRCNCASSIYHSLQSSVEKRFSAGLALAMHYTWSAFIDDASDIFNASASGDVGVSQDSFNRRADRGRSTYDRPHRFVANGVKELPFLRGTQGLIAKLIGGWQVSGFLTLQSGAPFSPLNGIDPGNRLAGISTQVGNAIRPNLNTSLDLSHMSIEDIIRVGGPAGARSLFSAVTAANPIGNAGRNILRADGINRIDLGINKNLNLTETRRLQLRAEFYNLLNSRDFGIPEANIIAAGFLSEGDTDGGERRVVVGIRYVF